MPTIKVENVSKYYWQKRQHWFQRRRKEIGVEDVSLSIEQGEFVYIIGSSGSGKSTLLKLIAGQDRPNKGAVYIQSENVADLRKARGRKLPLLIGYVSQQHTLDRSKTIGETLEQAARVGLRKFGGKKELNNRIQKALGLTGLSGRQNEYPGMLTAGECRRVELAKALINSPPILVLDEVTANLDADSMWDVFLLLNEINAMGTTIVMSTHNINYVNMVRRRVVTLVDGRLYSDEVKGRYGEVKKK
ncbi:MAG: ATP-binding cassette domain-containing protein [Oscillospiraceae bacterium]|nr:ATP-binding cassette domain-containing protein [Oscillospiraceae bacterium]